MGPLLGLGSKGDMGFDYFSDILHTTSFTTSVEVVVRRAATLSSNDLFRRQLHAVAPLLWVKLVKKRREGCDDHPFASLQTPCMEDVCRPGVSLRSTPRLFIRFAFACFARRVLGNV